MIISADEYYSKLHLIKNANPPAYAIFPRAENGNIFNINAHSRIIDAPEILGVEHDHKAVTIYFVIDRWVDYMDMSQTCCNIYYRNKASGVAKSYIVPFYDVYTLAPEKKMLIPWNLDAAVLSGAGEVEFSIHFFKVGEEELVDGTKKNIITYSLHTQSAKSKVIAGVEINDDADTNADYALEATQYDILNQRISDALETFQQTYWTILD